MVHHVSGCTRDGPSDNLRVRGGSGWLYFRLRIVQNVCLQWISRTICCVVVSKPTADSKTTRILVWIPSSRDLLSRLHLHKVIHPSDSGPQTFTVSPIHPYWPLTFSRTDSSIYWLLYSSRNIQEFSHPWFRRIRQNNSLKGCTSYQVVLVDCIGNEHTPGG